MSKGYQTVRDAFMAEALGDMDRIMSRIENVQRRQEISVWLLFFGCFCAAMAGGVVASMVLVKHLF